MSKQICFLRPDADWHHWNADKEQNALKARQFKFPQWSFFFFFWNSILRFQKESQHKQKELLCWSDRTAGLWTVISSLLLLSPRFLWFSLISDWMLFHLTFLISVAAFCHAGVESVKWGESITQDKNDLVEIGYLSGFDWIFCVFTSLVNYLSQQMSASYIEGRKDNLNIYQYFDLSGEWQVS